MHRDNRLECRYDTLGGSGPKLNDFMIVGEIVSNDNVVESFQCEQIGRDFLPRVLGYLGRNEGLFTGISISGALWALLDEVYDVA